METDYLSYLKRDLNLRQEVNPSYSMRAFARDLNISISTLSEIFSEKHHISYRTATKIVKHMKLSCEEKKDFIDRVTESAKSKASKKKSQQTKAYFDKKKNEIPQEMFEVISDWQHFAILELTHLYGFQSDPQWIAETLGIEESVANESLARLEKFGALNKVNNHWELCDDFQNNLIDYDVPMSAVKNFHIQCMKQIMKKIFLPIEQREFSTSLLPINLEEYEEVKKRIKKFKSELLNDYCNSEKREELYALGIQFVPLSSKRAGGSDV